MFSDGENIWVFVRDAYRPRDDNTQIKLEDTGRDRMHSCEDLARALLG